ncbi:urease accessory protein UreD [Alkalihalobacillus sp. BA299]|uniref:urease accessory protein UreD n=1 Tax=Alkalihalobacillus sp. BA299 TaxID=2815938 RepID=UPI001ADA9730|nr:urease accessory protein UreD [Alkalihalobacillus sp. BA299]
MLGRLNLTVKLSEEKSILSNLNFSSPVKVMRPFYLDDIGTAYLYIMDISGGMLSNDTLDFDIRVEKDSHLYITNNSATKIHPMEEGFATINNYFLIKEGASLEYFPEEITLYKDSSLKTSTIIDLHEHSCIAASEILFMGRKNYGEVLNFKNLTSHFEIRMKGNILLFERFNMDPQKENYKGLGFMENYSHYGSLYLYSPQNDRALLETIRSSLENSHENAHIASSLHHSGVIVIKALSNNHYSIKALFKLIWQHVRPKLLKERLPYIRK